MKRIALALLLALVTVPVAAQDVDHTALVANVKADLVHSGVPLADSCGAFAITKRVAWSLRAEGAGLLSKPSGNNCDGFAVDIVAYPSGRIVDILSDGGGANGPGWGCCDQVDPTRYRPAVDPGDSQPPVPTPTPAPIPPVDLSPILTRLAVLEGQLADVRAAQAALMEEQRATHASLEAHRDAGRKFLIAATKYVATAVAALFAGLKIGQ